MANKTKKKDIAKVAPGGKTKAELINTAASINPFAGSVEEAKPAGKAPAGTPQRVKSQSERLAEAKKKAPTTLGITSQEDIEKKSKEARAEQHKQWDEPETLSTQVKDVPNALHAADKKPGGRLDDTVVDYFPDGRDENTAADDLRERETERLREAEEEQLKRLQDAETNDDEETNDEGGSE